MEQETTQKPTQKPSKDLRDAKGRFLSGNRGGPGRDSKHAKYQMLWDRQFGTSEFKRAAYKLFGMALQGNTKALIYFLDRCMGKVKEQVDITQRIENDVRNPEELRQEFMTLLAQSQSQSQSQAGMTPPSNN